MIVVVDLARQRKREGGILQKNATTSENILDIFSNIGLMPKGITA